MEILKKVISWIRKVICLVVKIFRYPIKINRTVFHFLALGYIYVSVVLFLFGWVKLGYAILAVLIIAFSMVEHLFHCHEQRAQDVPLTIQLDMLLLLILVVVLFGTVMGWTGEFAQTGDWFKHNCILSDLTTKSWPVYYENYQEKSMLTYYIGQYLFGAWIGKMADSVEVAQTANGIWAMVGLFLSVIGVCKVAKANSSSKQVVALFMVLFFSSCMVLSQYLGRIFADGLGVTTGHYFIFSGSHIMQLSSNVILFRWVMPQCIVPLLALCLVLEDPKNVEHYAFIGIPVLLYASLPFLSLVGVLVVAAFIYLVFHFREMIGRIFSFSNIAMIITLGAILLLYFMGNLLGEKPDDVMFKWVSYPGEEIKIYIFFILSFILYAILLFPSYKKNPFYYLATVVLLLLPFGKMGVYNDFVMRVSITPLFIYMILCIHEVLNAPMGVRKVLLMILLVLGSYASVNEFSDCVSIHHNDYFGSLESFANRDADVQNDLKYNYYSYDLDKNIFYRYVAKETKQ